MMLMLTTKGVSLDGVREVVPESLRISAKS